MNNLVIQNNKGNDVTTSLIVAQVFGKEHNKVIRDIENLSCSDSFQAANFGVSFIIRNLPNGGHKQEKIYEMTKDGFSFLVMGYTGEKAGQFKEKFINEFNTREQMLKSDDYILMRSQQILQRRIEIAEQKAIMLQAQNEQLTETVTIQSTQLEQDAPKVEYYEKALKSESVYNTTQIAKEFGWGAKTLNRKLQTLGIQYLCNGQWVLYSRYQNKGYTKTNSYPYGYYDDGTIRTRALTVWTEKGRKFLHDLFD